MKDCIKLGVALLVLSTAVHSQAQGTFQWIVTFNGSPQIAPSDEFAINYYYEQGMEFTPIGSGQFGRSGGQPSLTVFPRNGTAYLYAQFGYSLRASSMNGARFGLVSVDLAEFSTLYQTSLSVQFVGYKPDGSTVVTEFITDGVIDGAGPLNDFETFYFDSRFADLVRVEVPTYRWSLDNMVFSNVIPEPSMTALMLLGGSFLGLRLLKPMRRLS